MNKVIDILKNMKSSDLHPDSKDDDVLIIDGTNMFIRCFAANPSQNDEGELVGGTVGFLYSLGSSIRLTKPTRVVIVFDGQGGSQRRKKIYSGYKQGRAFKSKLRRDDGFSDLIDEDKSMRKQFARLMDYLETLPVTVITIDSIEADDVIAYMTKSYFKNNVSIVSTDKDFLQLVNDRISVFSPIKKIDYNLDTFIKTFGIYPHNYIFMKCILGDKSDGIPGIKGVGIKTILSKLDFLLTDKQLTFDDFITEIKNIQDTKSSYYKKLINGIDDLERNYKLMQLEDVSISGDKKSVISEILNMDINPLDIMEFYSMCKTDLFSSVIRYPTRWLQENFNTLEIFRKK
jgi:5'-3' exonuclease